MTGIWDLLAWFGAAELRPEQGGALVRCRACGAEAVIPVDWEDGGDEWHISLRCGACGDRRDVTLDDGEAREFDRALDRGVRRIGREVRRRDRQRLEAETESLSIALEQDLIGADDFAPRRSAR
jgi:hypothetical protein